jgi:hypothetical protein
MALTIFFVAGTISLGAAPCAMAGPEDFENCPLMSFCAPGYGIAIYPVVD